MVQPIHSPRYLRCPDPDNPYAIVCRIDGEDWPCAVKRSHHITPQRTTPDWNVGWTLESTVRR